MSSREEEALGLTLETQYKIFGVCTDGQRGMLLKLKEVNIVNLFNLIHLCADTTWEEILKWQHTGLKFLTKTDIHGGGIVWSSETLLFLLSGSFSPLSVLWSDTVLSVRPAFCRLLQRAFSTHAQHVTAPLFACHSHFPCLIFPHRAFSSLLIAHFCYSLFISSTRMELPCTGLIRVYCLNIQTFGKLLG